jgi:hypothetical protein
MVPRVQGFGPEPACRWHRPTWSHEPGRRTARQPISQAALRHAPLLENDMDRVGADLGDGKSDVR